MPQLNWMYILFVIELSRALYLLWNVLYCASINFIFQILAVDTGARSQQCVTIEDWSYSLVHMWSYPRKALSRTICCYLIDIGLRCEIAGFVWFKYFYFFVFSGYALLQLCLRRIWQPSPTGHVMSKKVGLKVLFKKFEGELLYSL